MKILINRCFGGFGLSLKARDLLAERGFKSAIEHKKMNGNQYGSYTHYSNYDPSLSDLEFRMHPEVIRVVEELGIEEASGENAKLKIKEFDIENFLWIKEHDGMERLMIGGNSEVW